MSTGTITERKLRVDSSNTSSELSDPRDVEDLDQDLDQSPKSANSDTTEEQLTSSDEPSESSTVSIRGETKNSQRINSCGKFTIDTSREHLLYHSSRTGLHPYSETVPGASKTDSGD